MSRRASSTCGVIAVMAVLVQGLPLTPTSKVGPQCSNDGPMQAIQAVKAEAFCKSYIGFSPEVQKNLATEIITATSTVGVTTITQTSTGTPTLFITVAEDFIVRQTTTVTRQDCAATKPAPTSIPSKEAKAAPLRGGFVPAPAPAPHVVHGRSDTKSDIESESIADSDGDPATESNASDSRVPTVPAFLSSFKAVDIEAACSCIQASQISNGIAPGTTTVTTVVTATPAIREDSTVTTTWWTMLPSAVVKMVNIGATATVIDESCVTPPPKGNVKPDISNY